MKINTKTEHTHYHSPFHPLLGANLIGMCDSTFRSLTAHLWLLISCSNASKPPQTVVQSKITVNGFATVQWLCKCHPQRWAIWKDVNYNWQIKNKLNNFLRSTVYIFLNPRTHKKRHLEACGQDGGIGKSCT